MSTRSNKSRGSSTRSAKKKRKRPRKPHPQYLVRDDQGRWRYDPDRGLTKGLAGQVKKKGIAQLEKLCRIANFMEQYLWIVPKGRKPQKFTLNAAQEVILQLIAASWLWLIPVYMLLPKSRQMGVSTFWQGFFFARAILEPNYRVFTISHQASTTREIFKMSRNFEARLPSRLQLPLQSKTQLGMSWAVRQHPTKDEQLGGSSIQLATIGTGDGLGMGYTIHGFHGSEVAVWAKQKGAGDISETWNSVSQGIAEDYDTTVAFESTPDGPDSFFYEKCISASRGEAGDWRVAFLPWYLEAAYSVSVDDYVRRVRSQAGNMDAEVSLELTAEERELCELIAHQAVLPGEEWFRWPTKLTLEQILWRRLIIQNKCDGKVEYFNRYYPSTFEMAFRARTATLFDRPAIDALRNSRMPPEKSGYMRVRNDVVEFYARGREEIEEATWAVEIWEDPRPGTEYVIGADVGEGVEGGDSSAAYVGRVDRDLGRVRFVARISGIIDPDAFTEQLDLLGTHYYDALLGPEINKNISVVKGLLSRNYPNLYWRQDPKNPRSKSRTPGWNTDVASRGWLLNCLRVMAQDFDLESHDHDLPKEMTTMVPRRTPGGAVKWVAREGEHDDHVIAAGITLALSGLCDKKGHREKTTRPTAQRDESVVGRLRRNQEIAKRARSGLQQPGVGYSMS